MTATTVPCICCDKSTAEYWPNALLLDDALRAAYPDSNKKGTGAAPKPVVRVEAKPETQENARDWQRVKNHAETAGLCFKCACQFGYGIQHGFNAVEAPCTTCIGVMAGWPIKRANGWRTPQGSAHHASTWKPLLAL